MAQIMTQIEDILKDKYKPALANQIGTEPSPFIERIRKTPMTNNTIKMAAPLGINGGFGFGAEGLATPKAGAQRYVQFELDAVDMYVDIQISNKTVQLASSNASAMLNALDTEIKGSYASAKWNVARALFGDGMGKLTTVLALSTAGNVCIVDDTKNLIEGLTVDFYASDAVVGSTPAVSARRIVYVNHLSGKVTFDGAATTLPAGFLTVQGSYGKELCGLGSIFTPLTGRKLYGIDMDSNPWIKPVLADADGEINDFVIYNGVRQARNYKGSNIDLLMMGNSAFTSYQDYMSQKNVLAVDKQYFVGGAVGYKVLVGAQEVIVVNESFVPSGEAWGVDTSSFTFEHTPWDFMARDSGIFIPIADTSIYRALLASYGNLICSNPGGCLRIRNCGAAD